MLDDARLLKRISRYREDIDNNNSFKSDLESICRSKLDVEHKKAAQLLLRHVKASNANIGEKIDQLRKLLSPEAFKDVKWVKYE